MVNWRFSPSVLVRLKHPEGIAFRVDKVSLPADVRNRKFRQCYDSARSLNRLRHRIEVSHLERTDEGICPAFRRRRFGRTLKQSSACATCFDAPVLYGQARYRLEPPSKDFFVEAQGTRWIVRLYFKINIASHARLPIHHKRGGSSSDNSAMAGRSLFRDQ